MERHQKLLRNRLKQREVTEAHCIKYGKMGTLKPDLQKTVTKCEQDSVLGYRSLGEKSRGNPQSLRLTEKQVSFNEDIGSEDLTGSKFDARLCEINVGPEVSNRHERSGQSSQRSDIYCDDWVKDQFNFSHSRLPSNE